MSPGDTHGLGYHDVDSDAHTVVLVANMDATAGWEATMRLRSWERQHLGLGKGERLLDVGCGRGEAAISLVTDLGSEGELVGIDASAAMLQAARQQSSGVPCAARFSVGDARALNEPDGSFDVVRSERTLQWLQEPASVVEEYASVRRPGGRLSLIDTDWSTLHIEVGNAEITQTIRDGLRDECNRPSNVGRRLAELAHASGCEVTAHTSDAQHWSRWDPDKSPAPDGCFSMASLAEDLVEKGYLESDAVSQFVGEIHDAARQRRFKMSLTMHALIAVRP